MNRSQTVNDVTQMNPVPVFATTSPRSTEELRRVLTETRLPVSIGGGHFSMGGHTASPDTLHIDLRQMNKVLDFDPVNKTIRVEAGIRWCDIQRLIDPHCLAIKIMQTYANFTVGGALSVNAHGRYLGLGPVVLSVRSILLVLADGTEISASPTHNREVFYAAIGGYGAIGIIAQAELDLVDNVRVERTHAKMPADRYLDWFKDTVQQDPSSIFHNADLYPPHYTRARAVTWSHTDKPATTRERLQPNRHVYLLEKYFFWAFSETPFGKLRREFLIDPVLLAGRRVHWRNYEAGYDVAELEPTGRERRTYVLQEYFVPYERIGDFLPKMRAIFHRYKSNIINVSIRHALGDPGTLLAWARGETFAFVVYYKQRTHAGARERVAIWTRELIDAALECGGTYYLPYQLHATLKQFHRAYPDARRLFALKKHYDPTYRLRNRLWDKYYRPDHHDMSFPSTPTSLFQKVYNDTAAADQFYHFLRNIFHLYPEDRFHALIRDCMSQSSDDEVVYKQIQAALPGITPALSLLRYALPALALQKREIGRQTAQLLGKRKLYDYVEIGSTGRYIQSMMKHLDLRGSVTIVNDRAPTFSPTDIAERGQLLPPGLFIPLAEYDPLALPPQSADLVTCFIGLHHMPPAKLDPFLESVAKAVRPGGFFVLRDHDVTDDRMDAFVSLAHCVFNAGLGESWETNAAERRHFDSVDNWIARIERAGFRHVDQRIVQEGDPTRNVLMAFERNTL